MERKELTRKEREYHAAMRVIIGGVTGANLSVVRRGASLTLQATRGFMLGDVKCHARTVDAIAWFIWKKMNAAVLLCETDMQAAVNEIVPCGIWAGD